MTKLFKPVLLSPADAFEDYQRQAAKGSSTLTAKEGVAANLKPQNERPKSTGQIGVRKNVHSRAFSTQGYQRNRKSTLQSILSGSSAGGKVEAMRPRLQIQDRADSDIGPINTAQIVEIRE